MSIDKKIKNYSAADIQKYWAGKLSAVEMHAMEKAAMDDPFLADAIEGYKYSKNVDDDLTLLKERIDKKTAAITPVINLKKKKFGWLRVAAAIIIITGVGLFAQQLLYNRSESISESKIENAEGRKANTAPVINMPVPDTAKSNKQITGSLNSINANDQPVPEKTGTARLNVITGADSIKSSFNADAVAKNDDGKKDQDGITDQLISNEKRENKEAEAIADKALTQKAPTDTTLFLKSQKQAAGNAYAKAEQPGAVFYENESKKKNTWLNNRYNYRVVDAQNNPVPFANVMNTRDNVGTYTDAKGLFNLISSDSIMDIQIRSLGYNSSNYKLVPSAKPGDLVLQEDFAARQQILADNRKAVTSVTRRDSAELIEPADGWGNYNTYVANNIQIPEKIRNKSVSNEVELTFDIDKSGQPVNIKVTRSSQCKECDDEAIRLLKEGPKWKRKGKKSKTSVKISVDR